METFLSIGNGGFGLVYVWTLASHGGEGDGTEAGGEGAFFIYSGASLNLYKGQVGDRSFVLCREVVLFSEVTNVLSLWELVLCSEVVLFSEVTNGLSLWEVESTCPLFRGCPLLRGDKCTITMGSGINLSFAQRLSSLQRESTISEV